MKKSSTNSLNNLTTTLVRNGILILAVTFLAGCGSKLSGTYKIDSHGGMPFEKMTFTSGSKVELTTAITEATSEASYVVDGDKLKISAGGQTVIFTIEKDGSINSGGAIGRFVKQ